MRKPGLIALSITVTLVSSMVVPVRANEPDDFMAKQTAIEKDLENRQEDRFFKVFSVTILNNIASG